MSRCSTKIVRASPDQALLWVVRLRQLLGLDDRMMEDLDLDEEDGQTVRRGGRLGDWSKIGWIAMQRGRRAPGVEFM